MALDEVVRNDWAPRPKGSRKGSVSRGGGGKSKGRGGEKRRVIRPLGGKAGKARGRGSVGARSAAKGSGKAAGRGRRLVKGNPSFVKVGKIGKGGVAGMTRLRSKGSKGRGKGDRQNSMETASGKGWKGGAARMRSAGAAKGDRQGSKGGGKSWKGGAAGGKRGGDDGGKGRGKTKSKGSLGLARALPLWQGAKRSLWRGAMSVKGKGGRRDAKGIGKGKAGRKSAADPRKVTRVRPMLKNQWGSAKGKGGGMKGGGKGSMKGGSQGRKGQYPRREDMNGKGKYGGYGAKGGGSGKGSRRPSWDSNFDRDVPPHKDNRRYDEHDDRGSGGGKGTKYRNGTSGGDAPRFRSDPAEMSAEDLRLMKKITIVAQLDKVPNPLPVMRGMPAAGGKGSLRRSSSTGSLNSRFGANEGR
eukprot:gnl/TRDRNA2_/TRDRNA2_186466_c0_seq1.p1 gnl/TRDRNA2_/TRDRNA2_186466_c0~~gnl/TRDRNA2_/TRDRNA2_186466_c0_seq1.p1  ORF type:complete len:446 (-),score=72.24 gnl/TRDRNA2_/TRDRNA2_186466_c0_seq1:73-1311(-)